MSIKVRWFTWGLRPRRFGRRPLARYVCGDLPPYVDHYCCENNKCTPSTNNILGQ